MNGKPRWREQLLPRKTLIPQVVFRKTWGSPQSLASHQTGSPPLQSCLWCVGYDHSCLGSSADMLARNPGSAWGYTLPGLMIEVGDRTWYLCLHIPCPFAVQSWFRLFSARRHADHLKNVLFKDCEGLTWPRPAGAGLSFSRMHSLQLKHWKSFIPVTRPRSLRKMRTWPFTQQPLSGAAHFLIHQDACA